MKKKIFAALTALLTLFFLNAQRVGDPKLTEVWNPIPAKVSPGKSAADAPSDAIVLFDGKSGAAWQHADGKEFNWKIDSGFMQVKPATGSIQTKQAFGSCQLHIEWRTPFVVKGEGQGRGNSGIFLMSLYELQVLDNYNNRTYSNGQAASIYKQRMPMVNACRPPGEWQTYDIIFTAPQFNADSSVRSAAKITVIHNGVLVQNNIEIWGGSEYIGIPTYQVHNSKLPIILQDHGDLVSFRNIWIREL
ncbi:MAG: DUF1080 domain-containing protein [Bacteroidetes bacterium]|nr:MAG: DUF1080 domain-containing protein [Bacteroidota bacterium]